MDKHVVTGWLSTVGDSCCLEIKYDSENNDSDDHSINCKDNVRPREDRRLL